MATSERYLRRLTRRLTGSPEQHRAEDAATDEAANTGAQRAIDCQRGQEVTMIGTLRSVEGNAKGCAGGVKAQLFDGTDTVTLVWLGQRKIPGIESGRTLRVHGRLGKLENGSKAIYNPHYEIQR
ncbi:MAG TPA: OB-fold nucleic acid binding domain-containing protein [Mycobacterium sp.]|nr:OB-fold nucleic acid binding domain-containing protein [Mycobacterium sp.]